MYLINIDNMANIPGGLLSGVSDELLNYITTESNERYLTEFGALFEDHLRQEMIHTIE